MATLIAALTALAAILCPVEPHVPVGTQLRYARPVGQTARYRLTLDAQGQQISLGEKIPVDWHGEIDYTEEVVASAPDAGYCVKTNVEGLAVRDATGSLAGGAMEAWPDLEFRVTPRGEVLDVSLLSRRAGSVSRTRALAALAGQPPTVVLPAEPAEVGAEWYWERDGSRQLNQLLSLDEGAEGPTAHVASTAYAPLALEEQSEALGLETRLEGVVSQRSEMVLLLSRGVPVWHKGEMRIQTKSTVGLALPDGNETFAMSSNLRIAFDVRLISIDGRPIAARD